MHEHIAIKPSASFRGGGRKSFSSSTHPVTVYPKLISWKIGILNPSKPELKSWRV